MERLSITPIPCLQDNYCYLIADEQSGDAWLVDPSEPGPPSEALEADNLRLRGILLTHHHWDHVGGVEELVRRASPQGAVWVAAHAHDRGRIPQQTIFVDVPHGYFVATEVELGGHRLSAAHIPGHTLGAIAWCIPASNGQPADIFTGDTLFAAGCGRLFEGTPAQMYASLQTICAAPPASLLWFGHEYTAANLRFAAHVEPDNADIKRRQVDLPAITTPSTVELERLTNPFVRAASVEQLGERRKAKDQF